MEAQVVALEEAVGDLKRRLDEATSPLRLARDVAALELCLTIYQLITQPVSN